LHVRRYQPEDAAALVALKGDTIRRINSCDYTAAQVEAWAPDDAAASKWPQRVSGRFVVVAEDEGHLVGFGDLEPDGHIDQFFVHADHQRGGVGRALLQALLAEAARNGVARVFSEVSITARPFFQAHGVHVDAEQVVVARGVKFVNFRMSRATADGSPSM
jgi:putative acetyltransferase